MHDLWIAVGPSAWIEPLAPLRDAHARNGEAILLPGDAALAIALAGSTAARCVSILVVEDPARPSIRASFPTPFASVSASNHTLLGWLRLDRALLASYAQRTVTLLERRADARAPLVLMGPREERYLQLLGELEYLLSDTPHWQAFRWSAERIRRARLVDALRIGTAAAIYSGHGAPHGWLAYGGLSAEHLTERGAWHDEQTSALLFSLACRTGLPIEADTGAAPGCFADTVTGYGSAGAVLAALDDRPHEQSRVLAKALVRALCAGKRSLGDILRGAVDLGASLEGYTVTGDPALCACSAPGAMARATRVFAPAPDDDLATAQAASAVLCNGLHESRGETVCGGRDDSGAAMEQKPRV